MRDQAIPSRTPARVLQAAIVVVMVWMFLLVKVASDSLESTTTAFREASVALPNAANTHREALKVQVALEHLLHPGGGEMLVADVRTRVDLLANQLRIVSARLDLVVAAKEPLAAARQSTTKMQELLHGIPDTGLSDPLVLERLNELAEATEVDVKHVFDETERYYTAATAHSLTAKGSTQTQMLLLGILVALLGITAITTSQRAMRRAVQGAERRSRALLEHSTSMVAVMDRNLATTSWDAVQHVLGWRTTQADVLDHLEHVHPDDRPGLAAQLRAVEPGDVCTVEYRMQHARGDWILVESQITNLLHEPVVAGLVVNSRDVTDQRRHQQELRHSQKLEAIGQLAAGIAHEINTPIQFIGDNTRFAAQAHDEIADLLRTYDRVLRDADTDRGAIDEVAAAIDLPFLLEEVPRAIQETLEGVDRVATIVRAIRVFGHPGGDEKTPSDINEAVRNTMVVSENEFKYVADIVTDLGQLPLVTCHLGEVSQVLINLVVNAAHAIRSRLGNSSGRGTITIRTRAVSNEAVIEVSDDGAGIDPAIADRIFEPFFTTKQAGVGTGQGLALAYSLVTDRHRGTIDFTSEVGVGTTFRVRLPIDPDTAVRPTGVLAGAPA